jgi:XTP/dITP diphosphohydrolase
MRLLLASGNAGKLAELRLLLADIPVELVDASAAGLTLPPETGDSYVANATLKARAAVTAQMLALGDDTGLEVDMLDGRPGLRSARFADHAGGWAQANRELATLVGLVADTGRVVEATLRCALALAGIDGDVHTAEGACPVVLRWPPVGDGPGFEPILAPADPNVPIVVDGVFTHRRRAFERLRAALTTALGLDSLSSTSR